MLADLAFLLSIAFALPYISMLAKIASAQPVPTIIKPATGISTGTFCLLDTLVVLWFDLQYLLCHSNFTVYLGLCTRWCHSRIWMWKKVDKYFSTPLNEMALGMVTQIILSCI
jgi:hypothetical protein